MSTLNAIADAQLGQEVVLHESRPSELTGTKFTAEQIQTDCPARLQKIAREIAEHFQEVSERAKGLDTNVIAINNLYAEAQELCDVGGYAKFRELFCPQLGKSQAYVRLAIAAGKTTLVEHLTEQRERKQRSRAKQRAATAHSVTVPEKSKPQEAPIEGGAVEAEAANSGTVPENSDPEAEAPTAPTADGMPETTNIASKRMPERPNPEGSRAAAECMRVFTGCVMELHRVTNKKLPAHFSETTISIKTIAQLRDLFAGLVAELENVSAAELAPTRALPEGSPISTKMSACGGTTTAAPEMGADMAASHG